MEKNISIKQQFKQLIASGDFDDFLIAFTTMHKDTLDCIEYRDLCYLKIVLTDDSIFELRCYEFGNTVYSEVK